MYVAECTILYHPQFVFFFQTSGWVFQQAFKTVSEGSVFTANILDAAASLWDSGAKTAHYSRDAE